MLLVASEKKIDKFQSMVETTERVGVSEFSRSKDWRKKLPKAGCFAVEDRSGIIGYMLSPDYASAVSDQITALEQAVEAMQIEAMFNARTDRDDVKTGQELNRSALDYFSENADALIETVNANQ